MFQKKRSMIAIISLLSCLFLISIDTNDIKLDIGSYFVKKFQMKG